MSWLGTQGRLYELLVCGFGLGVGHASSWAIYIHDVSIGLVPTSHA